MATGDTTKKQAGIGNDAYSSYANSISQNPELGITDILKGLGKDSSVSNPFTQFLLNSLANNAGSLLDWYAPAGSNTSAPGQVNFLGSLVHSFYPTTAFDASKIPGFASAPAGALNFDPGTAPNLVDRSAVGQDIANMLAGNDASTLGQQFKSGVDSLTAYQTLKQHIDDVAAFSMDNLTKNIIENQLLDMYNKYMSSVPEDKTGGFQNWLLDKAADWLNVWFNTKSVDAADRHIGSGLDTTPIKTPNNAVTQTVPGGSGSTPNAQFSAYTP